MEDFCESRRSDFRLSARLASPCGSRPFLLFHKLGQSGVNPSLPTWTLVPEMSNDDRAQADRYWHFLRFLLLAAMPAEFREDVRRQNVFGRSCFREVVLCPFGIISV